MTTYSHIFARMFETLAVSYSLPLHSSDRSKVAVAVVSGSLRPCGYAVPASLSDWATRDCLGVVMDETSGQLPPSLRVPVAGDTASFTWRADIGTGARLDDLAIHLNDLAVAVAVGERWGSMLARAAAQYQLVYEVSRRGPRSLIEVAEQSGLDVDLLDIERWYFEGPWMRPRRPGRPTFWSPDDLLRTIADLRVPESLGSSMRVQRLEYQNPLEVVLYGSGFLLLGSIYVARIIRDWSSARRQGSAAAQAAEAHARQDSSRADLLEWLVQEAKAGRLHVPPGDLLNSVTADEGAAMERLSDQEVQLQLPSGSDPTA